MAGIGLKVRVRRKIFHEAVTTKTATLIADKRTLSQKLLQVTKKDVI